jgi:hypothetical protein
MSEYMYVNEGLPSDDVALVVVAAMVTKTLNDDNDPHGEKRAEWQRLARQLRSEGWIR